MNDMPNPDYVLTEHDKRLITSVPGVDERYIRIARMTPEQLREASTVEAVPLHDARVQRVRVNDYVGYPIWGYRAMCYCHNGNWRGPTRQTEIAAQRDADRHNVDG